ncbi:LysR family transcriptional regulator [Antarctobacter sp.]|uniref:LysR family transcriptional regulator n=1 Tax=Antarctobacter sp. TaxID=1872577 RepID=UPI002B26CC39|nr:LysR family transcriptional regulator [Antarctobacter sp.]
MIDRQHLTIIREVSRSGSVTAAADRMNLSQSAVSHAIAKLEDRHQVKVWRKKGRSLEFTQAGAYLCDLAERMVPELEHAERVLADISRGRRGAMRIGMECHPCEKWLMRVTAPYLAAWPVVDLEVRTAFRFDGIAALQAHEIDVLVTPDPVKLPDLHFTPVFDQELLLAVHDGHRLAGRKFIVPEDLLGEDLLTVPVTPDRLDIYSRFLVPADCRPARQIGVESTELMLQLVAAARGISVMPDWLIREDATDMPITTIRVGPQGLHKSINLGVRRDDAQTDYIAGLFQIAKRVHPIPAPS